MAQIVHLSTFLVSVSVFHWTVLFAESPPLPLLYLQPQYSIYIQGEEVRLVCSTPAWQHVKAYTFWEEREGQVFQLKPQTFINTFVLDGTSAGRFYCTYWISESGSEIHSSWSNFITVARTELPPLPTLSLQPQYPLYILGEEVTLTCSVEKRTADCEFFEKRADLFSLILPRNHNNMCRLDGKAAGTFRCRCWFQVSGRVIGTQLSNSVSVARTDPLPPPVLKVDPPSGAVNKGEHLLISCLTNRSNTEKLFHFYKDGVEMDFSSEGTLRSPTESGDLSPDASLRIPQANSSHSGEFACSYEESMRKHWVPSLWSQSVNITVLAQHSSLSPLVYTCFTLPLLILVVSLICYFCWKNKREASKGKEEFHPPQKQEETNNLRRLEPQAASSQLQVETRPKRLKPVEENEVSYSEIQFRPPNGMKRPVGDNGVSYSKIQCGSPQGLKRLRPVGEDGVTYCEIQVQPTHRAAK